MVIAAMWTKSRDRKARQEGRREMHAEWNAWLERYLDAKAKGIPFDEPHPKPID